MLNAAEKSALLDLARRTLESYLSGNPVPEFFPVGESLNERKGAFISLHNGDDLRGCIGQLMPDMELSRVVQQCTISAASEDMRFEPITGEELPDLKIEISVLSPFRRISEIEEIEVGRHGLYMTRDYNRGLLLPQVATENNWDRMTFLIQTCRKSGLPDSAWQDPKTAIYTFEAEVFAE